MGLVDELLEIERRERSRGRRSGIVQRAINAVTTYGLTPDSIMATKRLRYPCLGAKSEAVLREAAAASLRKNSFWL